MPALRRLTSLAPLTLLLTLFAPGAASADIAVSLLPLGPDGDDLSDPYGAPARAFEACAAAIVDLLRAPFDLWAPGLGAARPGGS